MSTSATDSKTGARRVVERSSGFALFELDLPDSIPVPITQPVLFVTVQRAAPLDDAEWEGTIRNMTAFYDSAEQGGYRFSLVLDFRQMGVLSPHYAQEWASLFLKRKEQTRKCVVATAIITSNLIVKTSLNLFFALYSPVRPMSMVDNVEAARAFVAATV